MGTLMRYLMCWTLLRNWMTIMGRKYSVYEGRKNGALLYIGTTIQDPYDRFRWHRANGKRLDFKVLFRFDNEKEMLDKEFELIQRYKPRLNKISHRRQNLNARLTEDELKRRKGDQKWCQCCLKRRVNAGYRHCYWCS